MGYYPQESLYKPYKSISTMGTLLGVHPIVPWLDSCKNGQLYLEFAQESIATDRQSRSHVIVLRPRAMWQFVWVGCSYGTKLVLLMMSVYECYIFLS